MTSGEKKMRMGLKIVAVSGFLGMTTLLSGCGMGVLGSNVPGLEPVAGVALHGGVMGGQQPVSGGTIQLYASGTTGYGSAATQLIAPLVTTNAGGNFTITGAYTCPSANTQVYIVVTGGNSGSGNNANLAMMAALGPCGSLSSSTYIFINELTTVASVYALAPFMTGISNVGTTYTNLPGLVNAFADVSTLVSTTSGTIPGPGLPSAAVAPIAELNTLGDILAACINSSGGSASDTTDGFTNGTTCGKLFYLTTPSGKSSPTDTVTAMLNLAQAPGKNIQKLYYLQSSTAPFAPALSSAPNDFTVAVNFSAGAFSAPSGLASDASGNIWIANSGGNTVTELTHSGAVLSGSGYTASLNAPSAVAIDTDGSVWLTNAGNNTVSRLTSGGGAFSGSPYSGGGLSIPYSISFDSLGAAWIANHGSNSITSITSSGTLSNYTPANAGTPVSVAVSPR